MYLIAPYLTFPYPSSNPAYRYMPSMTTIYHRYSSQIWNKNIFHVVCGEFRGGFQWFGWFALVSVEVWGGLRRFGVVCGISMVPYHCERLRKSDIESIENTSSNEAFCCKDCKSESVKIPSVSIDDSSGSMGQSEWEDSKSNRKAMNRIWNKQKANPALKSKAGNK